MMILVIHGTNRSTSLSRPVSDFVLSFLTKNYEAEVKFLDLSSVPIESFESEKMYQKEQVSPIIRKIQSDLLVPASKVIFISPEYNGSFPGILKLFIDACSISLARQSFYHKKALLIGVASGRAGNLRGMEHLTGILMYMNMIIYPNKLPISKIESLLNDKNELVDLATMEIIEKLLKEFIEF